MLATACRPLEPTITTSDGDMHRRLRMSVSRVLTPRKMAGEEGAIRRDVDTLIDDIIRRGKCSTDLINSFGWSLPLLTVTRLLGVPASDMEKFHRWGRSWLRILQATDDPDSLIECARDVVDFQRYFMAIVESPNSKDPNTFVGQLRSIELPGQDPLSNLEAMRIMVNIVLAGHVTVTRSIGNAVRLLHDHPQALEKLRAKPEVVETMVEEILRYEFPRKDCFELRQQQPKWGEYAFPRMPASCCTGARPIATRKRLTTPKSSTLSETRSRSRSPSGREYTAASALHSHDCN